MKNLLIHDQTRHRTENFIKKPAHALIISGPAGSGKLTLAEAIAEKALGLNEGNLQNYPYAHILEPESGKNSIGIGAVRELDHFFGLKVPLNKEVNRVVIVENSHLMTLEAQNALLKLLEEPPERSLLILTTASEQALLPTIRSRAQNLAVIRPLVEATQEYFQEKSYEASNIKQCYAISGGLPGLMSALLADEEHPLKLATEWARKLLSQSAYERLLSVDELAKNKQLATDTAFILQQMAHVSLQSAEGKSVQKWQNVLKAGYETAQTLSQNAQPKLVLTNLMLRL